ncbi:MAG: insulinase family protein [Endomicrobiales bacterium]|nr:insulinase family protein [Endomicrobiales bacterium]
MKNRLIYLLCAMLLPQIALAEGNMESFTLTNGIKVIYKQTTQHPIVSIRLFLKTGTASEKPEQAGLANFTQILLQQGTRNLNAQEFANQIESLGANFSASTDYDFSTISITLLDKNFEKALSLLTDAVLNPAFDELEIEKERSSILADIKSRKDSIHLTANDAMLKVFYGTHPYSWPQIGKEETASTFTKENIINWHKSNYTADNALIVITGNVSANEAKILAEKYFSQIPKSATKTTRTEATIPKASKTEFESSKFKQAFLIISYPAPKINQSDFLKLKLLNVYLGGRMSGVLFSKVREELGVCYEINSSYPSMQDIGRFSIYAGVDKENVNKTIEKIDDALNFIKTNGISDKELEETKDYLKGIYSMDHETIAKEGWYLGYWEMIGKGFAYDQKYIDELSNINAKDLTEATTKYFTQDRVIVTVVPK